MKKRLLALLVLALVMVLALASCEGFIGDLLDQLNPPAEDTEYVVYFMAGEGAYVPAQTVMEGELVTEPDSPTKSGYDFAGWYKDEACTEPWNFESDVVTENTMIYAKWIAHVHVGGKATCEKGPICTSCGKEYDEALGHKGGEATCEDPAVCEVCGEAYGELASHTVVVDEAVAPTCVATGLTEGKHCSVCGETLVAQEEVPVTDHTPVVDEAVAPTCTATGLTEGKHCSVCDETLVAQEEVPMTEHTPTSKKENEVKGDCLTASSYDLVFYCKDCEVELQRKTETTPAPGHNDADNDDYCDACGNYLKTLTNVHVNISNITGITDNTELVPGTGISNTTGMTLEVTEEPKAMGCISFSTRFKLGGTMKYQNGGVYRGIKIVTNGPATIVVYAISGSSSATRTLRLTTLVDETLVDVSTNDDVIGTDIGRYEFTVTEEGTYYLGSANSGINLYYIAILYTPENHAHECNNRCPDCGKCLNEACTEELCIEKCSCHKCESPCEICGKCTDSECAEEVCIEKCQGHEIVTPPLHTCESVCPECGKCLDKACAESACAEKCQGHAAAPVSGPVVNISDLTITTTTSAELVAGTGIYASGGLAVDNNNKSIDGFVFTRRLKLGGAMGVSGGEATKAVKIVTKGAATIVVYGMSSSSSETRTLRLATLEDGSLVNVAENAGAAGDAIGKFVFEVSSAGTYYLGSKSGGINIYYIAVVYSADVHSCESVCPECGKCLDVSCTESACAEKCQGHVVAPPHSCESVCPECGKCLDKACTEPACIDKCEGHSVTPPTNEYSISYEGLDGWLLEGYSPDSAKEGDTVILRTGPIMDAELELYVNGVKINQTHADYDYWEYVFTMPGEDVTVTKKVVEGFLPNPAVGEIEITLAEAGAETIYFEWLPVEGVDGYKVYCDTILVDNELIRFYGDHYRCDILGIRAELHFVKVVPVKDGVEIHDSATEFSATPTAHVREGFAFVGNGDANGAYNADGTLKAGAVVLYVTNTNKNTISLTMKTDSKKTETKTGIQNILLGLKKGYYEYPICIRFLGNITDPAVLQGGDLAVDINNGAFTKGITIEGVGNDTVFNGFGLKLKGAKNVEVRNIAFMNCNSSEGDNVSLTQDNEHIWVHNCDFFYGDAGSDADQAKGDGALDTKVSQYITYSYNHFWDCGKVHLNGNGDETVNYITYHHNWYDHCDSRMPRVRVSDSIHVYNNFYDGISKYGVGATTGCSIFVENNYFLNTSRPMSISMQGLDNGTFSSEAGGMIKAYGNVMIGCTDLITYSENKTSFDYYDAKSRDELVPSGVVALKGGATYSNFDTDADMYSYNVQSPEAAMESVKLLAGRVQGGDIKWTFTDKDNSDYDVNAGLKSVLKNYKSSLVSVGGVEGMDTEIPEGGNNGVDIPEITNGIVHNFTTSGTTSDFFQIEGNLSTSKGAVTYDGLKLTQCLKMESSTKITFTLSKPGTIILVIGGSGSKNEWRVDVDGVDHQNIIPEGAENYMLCIVELEAGTHTITKKDQTNLYYIVIEQAEDAEPAAE